MHSLITPRTWWLLDHTAFVQLQSLELQPELRGLPLLAAGPSAEAWAQAQGGWGDAAACPILSNHAKARGLSHQVSYFSSVGTRSKHTSVAPHTAPSQPPRALR